MPEIPMGSQLYLGRGLNNTTGELHGVAIDFDPAQPMDTGQNVAFQLVSINSSRELTETLNIAASAAYKVATFGVSAEFSLANSKQLNSYYTYALVRIVVVNPAQLLRNPRLRQVASDLLVKKGWAEFAASYGWEYVEGYIDGGSYYAMLEIQTTSVTQQRDIKLKLSGYYGPFSASGEFKQALKDIAKSAVINVSVTQSGGSGTVIATDLDGMLKQAENFPAVVKANPVPIIALISDYRGNVPLPPVPPPDSVPRLQQRDTLQDLGHAYLQLRDYKANLEFIVSHFVDFDDFRGLEPVALEAKRHEFQASLEATAKEIDRVVRLANSCSADFAQCQTYVPAVQFMSLPSIGGVLLNLKQMEEKLAALEMRVTADQGGSLELGGTSTSPAGGTPYIDFHYGNLAQDSNVRIINDADGQLSFSAKMIRFDGGTTLFGDGRLHIGGNEFTYVLNKNGLIVSNAWGGSGDLHVDGALTVNGPVHFGGDVKVEGRIGSYARLPNPITPHWGGGLRTLDVELDGTGWAARGWQTGPRDLAENFAGPDSLEPGDVVCLHPDQEAIIPSSKAADPMVCGVVSTAPGVLLNAGSVSDSLLHPVAMCGRVPCKVVGENGSIKKGDLLTSSSTPAHAMKARLTDDDGTPVQVTGTIVGKALEDFDGEAGEIEVYVLAG